MYQKNEMITECWFFGFYLRIESQFWLFGGMMGVFIGIRLLFSFWESPLYRIFWDFFWIFGIFFLLSSNSSAVFLMPTSYNWYIDYGIVLTGYHFNKSNPFVWRSILGLFCERGWALNWFKTFLLFTLRYMDLRRDFFLILHKTRTILPHR